MESEKTKKRKNTSRKAEKQKNKKEKRNSKKKRKLEVVPPPPLECGCFPLLSSCGRCCSHFLLLLGCDAFPSWLLLGGTSCCFFAVVWSATLTPPPFLLWYVHLHLFLGDGSFVFLLFPYVVFNCVFIFRFRSVISSFLFHFSCLIFFCRSATSVRSARSAK